MPDLPLEPGPPIWVDSEVHLFPPEWCEPNYDPPASEISLRSAIYDYSRKERDLALARASVEGLLAEMERSRISKAVIMGLPWRDPAMCWRNNAYIAEAVQRYPDKLIGLGVLPPPHSEDCRDGVRRLAEDYGLKGLKVIPSWQDFRLHESAFEPALEELAALDLVLFPHTDHLFIPADQADTAYSLYEVGRRYPELRIMAPHLGGLLCLYDLHSPVRPALKNMLFITSVPATMQMVSLAVQVVGPERVAFGTDFPFNPSHDQCSLRQALEALDFSPEEQRLIAGENTLRFLDRA